MSSSSVLSVLLTNYALADRAGTELVVRDLALALKRAGHRPMAFSPVLGEVAQEIAAAGIPVADRMEDIPAAPDIIHGQHHVPAVEAMLRFPEAPAIYACHARTVAVDVPPQMPGIMTYVVPDENCRERVALLLQMAPERIQRIGNWVDTALFAERAPLPAIPRRALVFSNYVKEGAELETIRTACQARGIALDVAGLSIRRSAAAPQDLLPRYDIVFAKARCALEAMAIGCAVVLYDRGGLGPMVSDGAFDRLRDWNFGMRLMTDPVTPAAIAAHLDAYDPADAERVSRRVREEATLDRALARYLALYRDAIARSASLPRLTAPERLRRYLHLSNIAVAHLENQVGTDDVPLLMRRLTATERRAISLKLDTALPPPRTGAERAVAVTIENRAAIALRPAPPYPLSLAGQWEARDLRRASTGTSWTWTLPAAVPADGQARFRFDVRPPRAGLLRLRVKLLQPDPLAPGKPTVIAETTQTIVVLPASLRGFIVHLCRLARGQAARWIGTA